MEKSFTVDPFGPVAFVYKSHKCLVIAVFLNGLTIEVFTLPRHALHLFTLFFV